MLESDAKDEGEDENGVEDEDEDEETRLSSSIGLGVVDVVAASIVVQSVVALHRLAVSWIESPL